MRSRMECLLGGLHLSAELGINLTWIRYGTQFGILCSFQHGILASDLAVDLAVDSAVDSAVDLAVGVPVGLAVDVVVYCSCTDVCPMPGSMNLTEITVSP